MPKFSSKSMEKLAQVHPKIVDVLIEAIKHHDFTVLCGARSLDEQKELVRTKKSKTMHSKHLIQDSGYSHAVDIAPWPIDWNDRERFIALAFFVQGVAAKMGVKLRLGVDWDGDLDIKEHSFFDGPHLELKE